MEFEVVDEYGEWEPVIKPVEFAAKPKVVWLRIVFLRATRRGNDLDGRTYTIEATVYDAAGHAVTVGDSVVVPHDRGR